MRRYLILVITLLLIRGLPAYAQQDGDLIQLVADTSNKRVDILVDGKTFTSYIFPDDLKKPVLWPVISPAGNMLTRSYPLVEKAGDRVDHPHQVGVWFNYGNVNGLDFWNNSNSIPDEKKQGYGSIVHKSVEHIESGTRPGLIATADWITPNQVILIEESTRLEFEVDGPIRIIDRTSILTALTDVKFADNKEGMFAIRVASELELPSNEPAKHLDVNGEIVNLQRSDKKLARGNYRSALGIEGMEVWGSRCRWMKLWGDINGETVSLVIIDHPENPGFPTYWHARGYGLFAANTLGQAAFTNGENRLNFKLNDGESATFKYRLVVAGTDLTDEQINQLAEDFSGF